MSKFFIAFPGTSAGRASLTRSHSSLIISSNDYNLLVDAGDGISYSFLRNNYDINKINSVLLSHFHPDHIAGLPSLIVKMKQDKRTIPLNIYVHSSLSNSLKNFLYSCYILPAKTKFEINITEFNNGEVVYLNNDLSFESRCNNHLQEYQEYQGQYEISLQSSSFLFKVNDKTIFYSGDIEDKNDLRIFEDRIDYYIAECAHPEKNDLLEAMKYYSPEKFILTHVKEESEDEIKTFARENNMIVAEDWMKIEI